MGDTTGPGSAANHVGSRAKLTFMLLLVPACAAPDTPPPVEAPTVPEEAQAAVSEPVSAPTVAPSPPEAADLCTDDGWCRPFVAMAITSAAATTEAVAVGTAAGTVALWADGRWRGGFLDQPGMEVRVLVRAEDGVRVWTCHEGRCAVRSWTAAGFGEPTPEATPPAPARTTSRIGSWQVEYSTLVRAGEAPLRLKPRTALGGELCATRFELLGDSDPPFALCYQYTTPSLHHVVGEELVTLVQPWASAWVPLPAAVLEGAGCAPCFATRHGVLLRRSGIWSVLRTPPSATVHPKNEGDQGLVSLGYTTPPMLELAVVDERVFFRSEAETFVWDGEAWTPTTYDGPWAQTLRGQSEGPSRSLYASTDALIVVGGAGGVAWRSWESFLPEQPAQGDYAQVHGVVPGDRLNVRAGPHAGAPVIGSFAPDSRCVTTLAVEPPHEAPGWRAVALAEGRRGWASARYLLPDSGCEGR